MSSSDHIHRAQFQENAEQATAREIEAADIADHARRGGTFYHGKQRNVTEGWDEGNLNPRQGLHVGTYRQAKEIVGGLGAVEDPTMETPIYTVEVNPRKPYLPGGAVQVEGGGSESRDLLEHGKWDEELLAEGYDVVPYRNWVEEPGALSYRILDPSSVTVDPVAEWGKQDLTKVLREEPYRTYDRTVTGRRRPTDEDRDWNAEGIDYDELDQEIEGWGNP